MVSSEASAGETCSPEVTRQYGITKPISLSGPSGSDLQRSRELEKFLVSAGLYESKEESALREEVLAQIDRIVKKWVKQLTREKGYTEQMVEESNAKVFTFGSYRLGVLSVRNANCDHHQVEVHGPYLLMEDVLSK